MTRYTFVVQVHQDGITTLEHLATRERIRIAELAAIGPQIGRWLAELEPVEPLPVSGAGDLDGGGQ